MANVKETLVLEEQRRTQTIVNSVTSLTYGFVQISS